MEENLFFMETFFFIHVSFLQKLFLKTKKHGIIE